jgi:peptidoglycan/LPS O-acetylase OafA/YrhL
MKVYFKNLNGIRFFSAAMVVIYHAFFFKSGYGGQANFISDAIGSFGPIAVNIFFILSSFLISYFLVYEKDKTGDISYKKFYIKRLLRIWPLYFAYGLMIICFSPLISARLGINNHSWSDVPINILFLLFFLVNVQTVIAPNPGICEIEWSVCIEEQFYLVWPILINKFRNKITALVISMVGIAIVVRIFMFYITPLLTHQDLREHYYFWNYQLIFDKLDLFAGGLVLSLIYRKRNEYGIVLKKVFHPIVQYCAVALILLYLLFNNRLHTKFELLFIDHFIQILLFGYFILGAVLDGFIFNFEKKLLNILGKISYGIYLFHTSIEQVLFIFLKKFIKHPDNFFIYDIAFPFISLLLTCAVAYLSYNFFELKFLRKKEQLNTTYEVSSGDSATLATSVSEVAPAIQGIA